MSKEVNVAITTLAIIIGVPVTIIGWTVLEPATMAAWTITYSLLILYAIGDTVL